MQIVTFQEKPYILTLIKTERLSSHSIVFYTRHGTDTRRQNLFPPRSDTPTQTADESHFMGSTRLASSDRHPVVAHPLRIMANAYRDSSRTYRRFVEENATEEQGVNHRKRKFRAIRKVSSTSMLFLHT